MLLFHAIWLWALQCHIQMHRRPQMIARSHQSSIKRLIKSVCISTYKDPHDWVHRSMNIIPWLLRHKLRKQWFHHQIWFERVRCSRSLLDECHSHSGSDDRSQRSRSILYILSSWFHVCAPRSDKLTHM